MSFACIDFRYALTRTKKYSESDGWILETQTPVITRKRGGAKYGAVHVALLVISTLLLTVAGVCLIYHMNILGVALMVLGVVVRFVDARL